MSPAVRSFCALALAVMLVSCLVSAPSGQGASLMKVRRLKVGLPAIDHWRCLHMLCSSLRANAAKAQPLTNKYTQNSHSACFQMCSHRCDDVGALICVLTHTRALTSAHMSLICAHLTQKWVVDPEHPMGSTN